MGEANSKMIKSAQRVLEVLEYFNHEHTETTVMDISRSLGYPQSSTSELLRCLVSLGYLKYNRFSRGYRPTARVALIGVWVEPGLFRDGTLLEIMDRIGEGVGLTVAISAACNYAVQHIHVVLGSRVDADGDPAIRRGDRVPLLHCPHGRLLLSTYRDDYIRSALHRLNAEEEDPARRVSVTETLEQLRVMKTRGWTMATGQPEEAGTLCVMVPRRSGGQRLVLSVSGRSDAVQAAAAQVLELVIGTRGNVVPFEIADKGSPPLDRHGPSRQFSRSAQITQLATVRGASPAPKF